MNVEQYKHSRNVQYVPYGSALLYCLPWSRGITYDIVCVRCMLDMEKEYGVDDIVLFDGYKDECTTKDVT